MQPNQGSQTTNFTYQCITQIFQYLRPGEVANCTVYASLHCTLIRPAQWASVKRSIPWISAGPGDPECSELRAAQDACGVHLQVEWSLVSVSSSHDRHRVVPSAQQNLRRVWWECRLQRRVYQVYQLLECNCAENTGNSQWGEMTYVSEPLCLTFSVLPYCPMWLVPMYNRDLQFNRFISAGSFSSLKSV